MNTSPSDRIQQIQRYFKALDHGVPDALSILYADTVRVRTNGVEGDLSSLKQQLQSLDPLRIATELHEVVAQDDRYALRLSHTLFDDDHAVGTIHASAWMEFFNDQVIVVDIYRYRSSALG